MFTPLTRKITQFMNKFKGSLMKGFFYKEIIVMAELIKK